MKPIPLPRHPLCCAAVLVLPCLAAQAQEVMGKEVAAQPVHQTQDPATKKADESPFTWVLGISVGNGPVFPGSDRRGNGLRPVLGLRFDPYTLSSGGGGSLLDFDLDARDSGVTARLFQSDGFRLNASLRLDSGRDGGDDEVLGGLPDIDRTVRGRISAVYDISRHASGRLSYNQDLLGKGGGGVLNATLQYEYQITPATELLFTAGMNWANRTYMRSYFGVPASAAGITSPLPLYEPGGGVMNTEMGVSLKTAVTDNWIFTAGLGLSQLRGEARRSPLALKPNNYSVSVGLAYRCCR